MLTLPNASKILQTPIGKNIIPPMAGPPPNFASLLRARRGYLSTVGSNNDPHLVPVCFTWAGDQIWSGIDGKPKGPELQRLKDIESNRNIAFLVDRWDEDWNKLAWLQARGTATVLTSGPELEKAYAALKEKYTQYEDVELSGPVIRLDVERWISWLPSKVTD